MVKETQQWTDADMSPLATSAFDALDSALDLDTRIDIAKRIAYEEIHTRVVMEHLSKEGSRMSPGALNRLLGYDRFEYSPTDVD